MITLNVILIQPLFGKITVNHNWYHFTPRKIPYGASMDTRFSSNDLLSCLFKVYVHKVFTTQFVSCYRISWILYFGTRITDYESPSPENCSLTPAVFIFIFIFWNTGGLAVAVPGELMGYWTAHSKFGKLPWKDLFNRITERAENGFIVGKALAKAIHSTKVKQAIKDYPSLRYEKHVYNFSK